MRINPEALRAIRERTGLSVSEFARQSVTVPSHVSNIEAGRRQASADLISRFADVLKVPVTAIIYEYEAAS